MHDTRIHILKLICKLTGTALTMTMLIEEAKYSQARDLAVEAKRIVEEIIERLAVLEKRL